MPYLRVRVRVLLTRSTSTKSYGKRDLYGRSTTGSLREIHYGISWEIHYVFLTNLFVLGIP